MQRGSPMGEGSGVALGASFAILLGFLLLPGLLAVFLYLFLTILGMVKGTDLRASTLNLPALFAGVAAIVAALVMGLFGAITILGRSLTPRKRRHAS